MDLDRAAESEAFSAFVPDTAATAAQIKVIDMVIAHLTEKGTMNPGLLYESPFTDVAPTGPEKVFDQQRTGQLIKAIEQFNESAAG